MIWTEHELRSTPTRCHTWPQPEFQIYVRLCFHSACAPRRSLPCARCSWCLSHNTITSDTLSLQTPPTPSFLPSLTSTPSHFLRSFFSISSRHSTSPHPLTTSPSHAVRSFVDGLHHSTTPPPCLRFSRASWLGGFYCAVPTGKERTCDGVPGAVAGWVCCEVWTVVVQ